MISQIKTIKDIGVFKNFDTKATGLTNDFGKINLLYGLNTYGKSTFSDILKDMGDGTGERINNRISVPGGKAPMVILHRTGGGKPIRFQNSKWADNVFFGKIWAFDSEFIFNNVFDGKELIEGRQARENFTDFILGDTGVSIAEELETLKREQTGQKFIAQQMIPSSQKGLSESAIKKYCRQKVAESEKQLSEQLKQIQTEIDQRIAQQNNETSIKSFSMLDIYDSNKADDFLEIIKRIQLILRRVFKMDAQVVEIVEDHVEIICGKQKDARSWIERGISYLGDGDICPFCGQTIHETKKINAWKAYLSKEYQTYLSDLQ